MCSLSRHSFTIKTCSLQVVDTNTASEVVTDEIFDLTSLQFAEDDELNQSLSNSAVDSNQETTFASTTLQQEDFSDDFPTQQEEEEKATENFSPTTNESLNSDAAVTEVPQIQLHTTTDTIGSTTSQSIIDEEATTEPMSRQLEPHSQVVAAVTASKNTRELVHIGVKNALAQEIVATAKDESLTGTSIEMVIATTIGFVVVAIFCCMAVAVILLRKRLRSLQIIDHTPPA